MTPNLDELIKELAAELEEGSLDDVVHQLAAEINNKGLEAQIRFLIEQLSPDMAVNLVMQLRS